MTGLLESAVRKPSLVWAHDGSVRSFRRERRSPAHLAIQRHRKVSSGCQGTLEYALLLVRFGLWRGTVVSMSITPRSGAGCNTTVLSWSSDCEGISSRQTSLGESTKPTSA